MYICNKCGRTKEELPVYRQQIGFWGEEPVFEKYCNWQCSCKGWYEIARMCTSCGQYYNQTSISENICTECSKKVMDRFVKNFSPQERWYIAENYE